METSHRRAPPSLARPLGIGLALAALVATACATTRQPDKTPEKSGFLGDYSMLQPGTGEEAGLVYIAPDAELGSYDAVLIEPVTLWRSSETEHLTAEERQALSDYMYERVRQELAKDYRIASEPGPGVMTVRIALTEAKGARVLSDTVTSVVPTFRLLAGLGGMATEKRVLVGAAAVEVEIRDSQSGRRLAAAVDERWGTRAVRGGIHKWSDVEEAFDYWAARLRTRLAEERTAGGPA